jgi:hypothetical protein
VFKTLRGAGLLSTVVARVKPVPQTKRMKDKYTVDKCALTAKLMREGESKGPEGENDEDEDGMSDEEERKGKKTLSGKGVK